MQPSLQPMTDHERRILIVDDDPGMREQIAAYLADKGFAGLTAAHAGEMDLHLARGGVDLVVLDLGLPGEDGLSICRRLRTESGPAVIIVSAAGDEADRVLGLELGADDYLTKPISPRELLARLRAVLRRKDGAGPAPRNAAFVFGGFTYDPARRRLRAPNGVLIALTGAESSLLGALLLNPRQIMTRDHLVAGHLDLLAASRAVDLQISRLRRKLQAHGGGKLIVTQRGFGYSLECDVSRA